jgi:hypothetical protein
MPKITNPLFYIIVPLTPSELQTPMRKELWEITKFSLLNQKYTNWKAIIVGEKQKTTDYFIYIISEKKDKGSKLLSAIQFINANLPKPDYILRLDDDDIIMPGTLEMASKKTFDIYTDYYHTFYDIATDRISRQHRPWIANTSIHKYEFAVQEFQKTGVPVFTFDHSQAWHIFYKDKNVLCSKKTSPLYIRILSPTSITSNNVLNNNIQKYLDYLKTFGKWNKKEIELFKIYRTKLIQIWLKYEQKHLTIVPEKKNLLTKILSLKWILKKKYISN